jgi:hypothetical protein
VRQVDLLTDLDIILERDILNLNFLIRPLVEKLTGTVSAGQNVSRQIQSNHVEPACVGKKYISNCGGKCHLRIVFENVDFFIYIYRVNIFASMRLDVGQL